MERGALPPVVRGWEEGHLFPWDWWEGASAEKPWTGKPEHSKFPQAQKQREFSWHLLSHSQCATLGLGFIVCGCRGQYQKLNLTLRSYVLLFDPLSTFILQEFLKCVGFCVTNLAQSKLHWTGFYNFTLLIYLFIYSWYCFSLLTCSNSAWE